MSLYTTPNESIETLSLLELLDPVSTTKLKKKLKNNYKNVTTIIYNDEIKEKLISKLNNLDSRLLKALNTSTTEKVFYSVSLYGIFLFGFFIGYRPFYIHIIYSLICLVLLPIRIYTYFKMQYQYFLADLCYYVNFLLMLFIWVFPFSSKLYITCFAFSFGTLSFAVITWRNSLVLHSIEKITSSFIHLSPPIVMFTITHQLTHEEKITRFPGAAKITQWNFFNGILITSLYYLIWQSLYHYFITIKKSNSIKNGKVTSFQWLRKSFKDKLIGKVVNSLPDPFPVIAFTFIQYFYQLLTMSICPIWFKYKLLAVLFLTFIFLVASYNGATYYVDFYGRRLEKEVCRLRKEMDELTQSAATASGSANPQKPELKGES